MNKTFILSVLFFLFLAIKPLSAIDSYEEKRIEKINVVFETQDPESSLDSTKVASRLKTQTGDLFSQLIFDGDLKMLSEEYDQVKSEIKPQNDKLLITLRLWPKPKIASINWSGNKIYKTSTLQKELGIKPGYVFSTDKFNTSLNKVKEYYIKKGFFESDISYSTAPLKNKNEIVINISVYEGKSGKINRIEFTGLTNREKSDLLATMYTKKYFFLTSWLTGQGIFRQEAIDQDQMTIMNYLNNKGYADAKVKIKFLQTPKNSGLNIEINVVKGIVYRVGKITFSGNTLYKNEEIEKKISIRSNDIFSPEKIRENTQAIKDLYGVKGYIETEVFQESCLLENSPVYNLHFQIEEGQQFKIGLIRVFGNTQTNTNVILRESLLVPGKVFDSRRLKGTQQRIQNIGYFENVNVYAVKSEEKKTDMNYRDVYIEVKETQTGNANLSLGFSSLNDVFGSFELAERNFNWKGLGSIFQKGPSALRGAGEYANAKVTLGRKQQSYFFTWMDPYFRDSLWRFGFDVSKTLNKLQSKDYKIKTYGSSVFASYPITEYFTYGTKYRIRHSNTDLKKIKTVVDREIEESHGLISAISTSIGYDSTDNSYKAHKGIRSLLEFEYAGVGGDFYFLKFNYLNALYFPLWEKGTLKFRADFRFIEPICHTIPNELPLSEKFFLGGETTVRGYKPYILGPRRPSNIHDPIGGISSTLLSLELSHHIFKPMDIFAFFDAGSVSDKHFTVQKLNASYGIGTRLEIMNRMPITIGYGVPINADHSSDKQKFFFSMGGQF